MKKAPTPPKAMRPKVQAYEDYRSLLLDAFRYQKYVEKGFTFRKLSERAGFSSPNFFQLVYQGKRNLSQQSVLKIASVFGWSKSELSYVETLVAYQQATTPDSKAQLLERLQTLKTRGQFKTIDRQSYEYYNEPAHIALREMVTLSDFKEDPEWIAARLRMSASAKQIQAMIESLLKLGFLKRREDGALEQADPQISTGPEVTSLAIHKYHQEMIREAERALMSLQGTLRDISSITFAIDASSISELKKRIMHFRRQILSWAEAQPKKDQVYQLNLQLFPLTQNSQAGGDQ